MSVQNQILITAGNMFTRFGITSVSMDAIAEHSGISKTTLYGYFNSKDALVDAVLNSLIDLWKKQINKIVDTPKNPVQKIGLLYGNALKELSQLNTVFIHDLKKYYSTYFESYKAIKTYFVFEVVKSLLDKAKAEGMLHHNTDVDMLCEMYFFQLDLLLPRVFNQTEYSHEDIFKTLVYPVLSGILKPEYRYVIDNIKP